MPKDFTILKDLQKGDEFKYADGKEIFKYLEEQTILENEINPYYPTPIKCLRLSDGIVIFIPCDEEVKLINRQLSLF